MNANKQKKKFFIIFGTVVIVSAVLGFFAGFLGKDIRKVLNDFAGSTSVNYLVLFAIFIALNIAALIVTFYSYFKAKKAVNMLKNDDAYFDTVEKTVDLSITVEQIAFVFSSVLNMVATTINIVNVEKVDPIIYYFVVLIVTVLVLIVGCVIMQRLMKIQNQLTPNLNMSVFDFDLMKTQEVQADEAQRELLYKSAYKSFRITSKVFMALFIIISVITAVMELSIITAVVVGCMVIFMCTVFVIISYKMQHLQKNKNKKK